MLLTLLVCLVVTLTQSQEIWEIREQIAPDISVLGTADGQLRDFNDGRLWRTEDLDTSNQRSCSGRFVDGSPRTTRGPDDVSTSRDPLTGPADARRLAKVPKLSNSDFECMCEWCDEHCPCEDTICRDYPWECGRPLQQCGTDKNKNWKCYCDVDVDGFDVCWLNDWCYNLAPCTRSTDCGNDEVCVTTCCSGTRCLRKCPMPFTPTPEPTPKPTRNTCKQDGLWECGEPLDPCGNSKDGLWNCVCDSDIFGNKVCWQDDWCSNLQTCFGHCPSPYHCVPDTCCGVPKCIRDCQRKKFSLKAPVVPL